MALHGVVALIHNRVREACPAVVHKVVRPNEEVANEVQLCMVEVVFDNGGDHRVVIFDLDYVVVRGDTRRPLFRPGRVRRDVRDTVKGVLDGRDRDILLALGWQVRLGHPSYRLLLPHGGFKEVVPHWVFVDVSGTAPACRRGAIEHFNGECSV